MTAHIHFLIWDAYPSLTHGCQFVPYFCWDRYWPWKLSKGKMLAWVPSLTVQVLFSFWH